MAKPKLFPHCAAILEFKRSIGENPTDRQRILSQILVKFILWILEKNQELYEMQPSGEVVRKDATFSFDDYLGRNLQHWAEHFIKLQIHERSAASLKTFLCNFKKLLEFLRDNNIANLNLDSLFEAETGIVKRNRVGKEKKEPKHLPVHPLVELYVEDSKFSNPKNSIFRLRLWVCTLMGYGTKEYQAYFSGENVEREDRAVTCLVKDQPIQDHSTMVYEIVSISSKRLEEVLTCLCKAYPGNEKHLVSEVRGFYAWLNSKRWATVTVPSKERREVTHPLVREYLSRFDQNTAYKQRKSRLKAMIAKILRVEQSKLIEYWTEDRIKEEERSVSLLKSQGLGSIRNLKDLDLYRILFIDASRINQVFDELMRENPRLERTTKSHVLGFYRWLRGNGWTELDVDRVVVGKQVKKVPQQPRLLRPKAKENTLAQPQSRPEARSVNDSSWRVRKGEVKAAFDKPKAKLPKRRKTKPKKENPVPEFQSKQKEKKYSYEKTQALAIEERKRRWAAEDQKKEAERQAQEKRREEQALKRKALFALQPQSSSPLERALAFVERNFDQRYYERKIQPLLIQEEDSPEFRDFYKLRNYLLYAFCYLYNIPKYYLPRFVNETQVDVLGMSDKAILRQYLELKKQLKIQSELLLVSISGASVFK